MRLVRRALAGAAASLALSALFTGVALGAGPNTEADADATISVGLGADDESTLDAGLDGILGVNDEAGTNAVVDLNGDAVLSGSPTATGDLAIGASAMTEATDGTAADADASATIALDAAQASLAGVGMNAGSVMIIDLDAGRVDAVGSSDVSLAIGADTDAADTTADADVSVTLGTGTEAGDSSADLAGALSLGAGTDATDGSADVAVALSLNGLVPELTDIGAVEGLSLESIGAEVGDVSTDAGSVDPTGAFDAVTSLIPEAVLGVGDESPDVTPDEVDGSANADLSTTPAGAGGSLPDTAFGPGSDVALWGLLLVLLAGLWVSGGAVPSRRR